MWRRAKMVVIGGGGEGKTATIRGLSDRPFELTESTIGAGECLATCTLEHAV